MSSTQKPSTTKVVLLTLLGVFLFAFCGLGVVGVVIGGTDDTTSKSETASGEARPLAAAQPPSSPAVVAKPAATATRVPAAKPTRTSARPTAAATTPKPRPTTVKPKPRPTTKKPKPRPTTVEPAEPEVYYKNCTAVRAAGAAPIHRGDPGYARHLDRDGDGVGCE